MASAHVPEPEWSPTRPDGTFAAKYPARRECAPRARTDLLRWLAAHPTDELVRENVALAVSEACTNAVLHAYEPQWPGAFEVTARVDGRVLRVVVADTGAGFRHHQRRAGMGMGLAVIASVADGVTVTTQSTGTSVGMTFVLPAGRLLEPPSPPSAQA